MKAVLCPICNGRGTVCNHDLSMPRCLHPTCPTCHGCGGSGWVSVPNDVYYPQSSYHYAIPEDRCPACGGLRSDPPLTSCPKNSHYGTYCETKV